jgi:hypothetical protein
MSATLMRKCATAPPDRPTTGVTRHTRCVESHACAPALRSVPYNALHFGIFAAAGRVSRALGLPGAPFWVADVRATPSWHCQWWPRAQPRLLSPGPPPHRCPRIEQLRGVRAQRPRPARRACAGASAWAGALAGALTALLTTPIDLVNTRLQARRRGDGPHARRVSSLASRRAFHRPFTRGVRSVRLACPRKPRPGVRSVAGGGRARVGAAVLRHRRRDRAYRARGGRVLAMLEPPRHRELPLGAAPRRATAQARSRSSAARCRACCSTRRRPYSSSPSLRGSSAACSSSPRPSSRYLRQISPRARIHNCCQRRSLAYPIGRGREVGQLTNSTGPGFRVHGGWVSSLRSRR